MRRTRILINLLFSIFNLKLTNLRIYERNLAFDHYESFILKWKSDKLSPEFISYMFNNFQNSKSQIQQDLVVSYLFSGEEKNDHFFVEFGATDGIALSNTFFLENYLMWNGILSEPAKIWHKDLLSNRSAFIDTRAVFATSGQLLKFTQDEVKELSGITSYKDAKSLGKRSKFYEVSTVSLTDLLSKYDAPNVVDYLSIDTEGSEFEILQKFDFEKTTFRFISVEHNFRSDRGLMRKLLEQNGYVNILEEFSDFDDWYLHKSNLDLLKTIYN